MVCSEKQPYSTAHRADCPAITASECLGRAAWKNMVDRLLPRIDRDGLSLLWSTFEASTVSHASKAWPATSCEVIISASQERYREQGIGRTGNVHRFYYAEPLVVCAYTIDDQGFSRDARTYRYTIPLEKRFQGFTRAENRRRATQWSTEQYPKAMLIDIYYNPEHPQQAVLIPSNMSWWKTAWSSGAGILLLVLGAVMLVSSSCSNRLSAERQASGYSKTRYTRPHSRHEKRVKQKKH